MNHEISNDHQWLSYLSRPRRFLLVEDEEGIRATFKSFASMFNVMVDEADDGEDGIRLFQERASQRDPYQAVFLDIRLPGMSGIDVFRELKRMIPELAVVVVSGYVNEELLQEIHEIGFAAFVRKPQDFNLRFFIQLFAMLGVRPQGTTSQDLLARNPDL